MPKPESLRPWYRITAKAEGEAEILIYDEIVAPIIKAFFGVGQSAKDFAKELKDLGEITALTIRINSPGGDVFEGQAIYSLLKAHKAKKTVYVDGLAASIASVIAMAGDEIIIPENALMMVHNPWGCMCGTADEMRQAADAMDKFTESIVAVYVRRTGKDLETVQQLMDEETWMTGAEAVELGFADRMTEPVQMAAKFDCSRFRKTPAALQAQAAAKPEKTGTDTHEEDPMDLITVDVIKDKHPAIADHFTQAGKKDGLADGRAAGEKAERARVLGILACVLPGQELLIKDLVEIGATIEEASKTCKLRKLGAIEKAAPESSGGGDDKERVTDLSKLSGDERYKAEWAQNVSGVREEFTSEAAYLAFKKADASGRLKILTKSKS
jgi:ATP-dependent Clp endopeptidase proteolytic subunit ClpP